MSHGYSYAIDLVSNGERHMLTRALLGEVNEVINRTENDDYCFNKYGQKMNDGWWENEEDVMRDISRRYPDLILRVWCATETGFYLTYYKDGMMQEVQGEIVYPPFDPEKLE